jgi:hypothetical protein
VILDNLVKIFESFDGSGRKQAPTGKQQQISQEQHRISPLVPIHFLAITAARRLIATSELWVVTGCETANASPSFLSWQMSGAAIQ